MARINIEMVNGKGNLEVGDIVISKRFGTRLIISEGTEYLGIDPVRGKVMASEISLEDLEDIYCINASEYRIVKAKNIVIYEEGAESNE